MCFADRRQNGVEIGPPSKIRYAPTLRIPLSKVSNANLTLFLKLYPCFLLRNPPLKQKVDGADDFDITKLEYLADLERCLLETLLNRVLLKLYFGVLMLFLIS